MKKIPLSKGRDFAIVDDEDFDLLSAYTWKLQNGSSKYTKKYYGSRAVKVDGVEKYQLMHRIIMGVSDKSVQVDHIDGNGLNNQRSNLRICNSSQNNKNRNKMNKKTTSIFKGVCFDKSRQLYNAAIRIDGKCKNIGRYKTEAEAAMAYNYMAFFNHGEFAVLNSIGY